MKKKLNLETKGKIIIFMPSFPTSGADSIGLTIMLSEPKIWTCGLSKEFHHVFMGKWKGAENSLDNEVLR